MKWPGRGTATNQPADGSPAVLRVDWPACQGRGVCAEVLPELVSLDEWGFPVIRGGVDDELLDLARQAAADCPHRALRLIR